MLKNKNNLKYIYNEQFKLNQEKVTEEQLIKLFNEKYFKTIMKIEKSNIDDHILKKAHYKLIGEVMVDKVLINL